MNILYTINHKYASVSYISCISLILNNLNIDLNIYFVVTDFSLDDYKLLEGLCEFKNVTVHFSTINNSYLEEYNLPQWRGTQIANARLFFDSIIPDVDRLDNLLYIDADTLVVNSLSGLYEYNDNIVSAVNDACLNKYKNNIGVQNYYNSGVIYINVKKWLDEDIHKKLIDTYKMLDNVKLRYPDQDLFNIALNKYISHLSLKYNVNPYMMLNSDLFKKLFFNRKCNILYDELNELDEPVILHSCALAGIKMWSNNNINPYNHEFRKYLDLSGIEFESENLYGIKKVYDRVPIILYALLVLRNYLPSSVESPLRDLNLKLIR